MATDEPTAELDPRFSSAGATARPWAEVVDMLAASEMFWLSTVRSDGRPHVTPLPAVWLEGALHFCTGAEEQKARNIASDARCVLTSGTNRQDSGLDVVLEGTAVRITDEPTLARLAVLWKAKLGWDYSVRDGAFRHPDGGEVRVFGVTPTKVLAFGKGEPFSQTRYRFSPPA